MKDSSETERIQIITERLKNNEHNMVVNKQQYFKIGNALSS